MTRLKNSYENLVIKKDLIKMIQKWRKILDAKIMLNITFDEKEGILHFRIEVEE